MKAPRTWTLDAEVLSDSGQKFDMIAAGPDLLPDEGVVVIELEPVLDLPERCVEAIGTDADGRPWSTAADAENLP